MLEQWLSQYWQQSDNLWLFYAKAQGRSQFSPALLRLVAGQQNEFIAYCHPLEIAKLENQRLNDEFNVRFKTLTDCPDFVVLEFSSIDQEPQGWQKFVEAQKKLQAIDARLNLCTDQSQLFKQAICEAQNHLYIDRLGILLLNYENNEMLGTWGTSESGELVDEHDFRAPMPDFPWVTEALSSRDHVAVWENVELKQNGKTVGIGWNAMVAIWDGEQCLGWIACDNLINRQPLADWQKEVLGQFGKLIAAIILRLRHTEQLQAINASLEQKVAQRSEQLQQKITLLESTQDELIEAEKLASLGSLVAGVAHEVNTPIGIGVTAASLLLEKTKIIQQLYNTQTMKKSELERYFAQADESSTIISHNLQRASELISSFKQLASEQSHDIKDHIKLNDLVDNLILSYQHISKKRHIRIVNQVDSSFCFLGYAGKINQILSNFINNSLLHAFDEEDEGEIKIAAQRDGTELVLHFVDNGKGVAADKLNEIFNPFYTTKRNQGGTGLGLNIVYNLVAKLQGSINVTLAEPKGLAFEVRIPVEYINVR